MKKTIFLLCLCLALTLSACTAKEDTGAGPNPETPDTSGELDEILDEKEPEDLAAPPTVAGASLYRGVLSIDDSAEETLYRLRQVEGTDFGAEELPLVFTDLTTFYNIEPEALADGDYLEVYYGHPGGEMPETVDAIQVVLLPGAELCIRNGTVASLNAGEDGAGSILLNTEDGEFLALYTDETQFYLDFDALAEGDRLNVYTETIGAEYMPPQALALEVRPYK